jgi:MFS transporter, MHS family, proline/betaine transporter
MTTEAAVDPTSVRVIDVRASRRALVAGSVGNLIEWYEFAIYGYMAPYIAAQFFPSTDKVASILATFVVFALAFFMRPIGAAIFGRLADRLGRRPILVTIILVMSIATALIGVLPTSASIGAAAAVLLVILRLAQGLSAGGELGGAVSFLVENAPDGKRGLYASWSFFGSVVGFVLGGGVATLLALAIPAADMAAWGWRIGFLIAVPLGIVALVLRLAIDETPHFKLVQQERAQVETGAAKELPKTGIRYTFSYLLITLLVLVVYNAVGNVFQVGMPTYLSTAFQLPPVQAYLLTLITGVVAAITIPIFGALSDRVGRWVVLLAGVIGTIVLSYPMYLLMDTGFGGGVVALALAGLLIGLVGGPMPAFLSERFPTRSRGTGVAVVYGISIALFGGGAPYVTTWIFAATHNPFAAAFYTIITGAISLIGLIAWRASRHRDAYRAPLED